MQSRTFRVASFNVSMEARNYLPEDLPRDLSDEQRKKFMSSARLKHALSDKNHPQIRNVAEIIQRVRPDILLLNEFDYIADRSDGIDKFQQNFLGRSQGGQAAIHYPHVFLAPSNTGLLSPLDINGDGERSLPEDAYGYGFYPGHYGMVLLSRFPIEDTEVRTFQKFLWSDMPGALAPVKPDGEAYYSRSVWRALRLSSKSHWDVPLNIDGALVHLLASHPTPPVFDGDEDRNGRRNHDELRFWQDYISAEPGKADYIYDDSNQPGGIQSKAAFIIAGDLNASVHSAESITAGIRGLLDHPQVLSAPAPRSDGGKQHTPKDPFGAEHTASWASRADYVIPSRAFEVLDSGVFWPSPDSPLAYLVESRESSSDHRLVWMDLRLSAGSP